MITLKYLVIFLVSWPIPVSIYLSTYAHYLKDLASYFAEAPHPTYQFIVVGSGSGGSVVAGRLAEAGHKVLLIEAGGASPMVSHIPALVPFSQLSPIDWQYKSVKQTGAALQAGGISNWPRGKVLGGSSMLNYMIYMRGHSGDYDEWSSLGVEGWAYKDVLPFFKKSENYVDDLQNDDPFHGRGGPLGTAKNSFSDPITDVFLKAGEEMGYGIGDMNGAGENGIFSYTPVTLKKGERTGTYRAFAEKQVGKNLRVITQSHATKLVLEGDVVKGVQVSRFGREETFYASGEVILSAGAIGTPQILMLSGIGDKKDLEELGIKSVLHSPHVGKNLQDHLVVVLPMTAPENATLDPFAGVKPKNVIDYVRSGTGPLSSIGGCGGNAFIHTPNNIDKRPDIQLHFVSFNFNVDEWNGLGHIFGMTDKAYEWYKDHGTGASFGPVLSRPKSRGYIKLASADPFEHPLIQPNYLAEEEDVQVFAEGIKFSGDLIHTKAFRDAGASPFKPFPACQHLQFESLEYYKCFASHFGSTLYHPVGTAAMGTVLDSKLRLKGLKNLRVADGSAIPKIMGGNTNAPIIMIGERAAAFILQDWPVTSNQKAEPTRTEL